MTHAPLSLNISVLALVKKAFSLTSLLLVLESWTNETIWGIAATARSMANFVLAMAEAVVSKKGM